MVKKTELMEGVGDTHGMRPRRKEDIVDWLIRVLYTLEYYDHGLLTYAGVVTLWNAVASMAVAQRWCAS